MIEEIKFNNELWAIIVRDSFDKSGISFFTDNESSQQLAFMKHPEGKVIQPHIHNPVPRAVDYTQEVLIIKSGKLRVDFYDHEKVKFDSRILVKGDVILLSKGGHGFEVLEDITMIEVKQGPYMGDRDKIRFEV
jgi:mannose-6-phosphate isomerase-like protein (cupin superfamily)